MFNLKKISAMLLAVILAVACKDSDKKNELSSVEEYPGWRSGCLEGVGDAEWVHGACNDLGGDNILVYVASIYALLSNPKFFDNKMVRTCGYLSGDIIFEDCSIEWSLYPTKEDFLHDQFTNGLAIDTLEYASYYGEGRFFRHMELPYGMYVCLIGNFSSAYHSKMLFSGFTYAAVFLPDRYKNIKDLNKMLDSLLKEGKDISDFQWSRPCSPFEIRKGKIRYVDVSLDCTIYESESKMCGANRKFNPQTK